MQAASRLALGTVLLAMHVPGRAASPDATSCAPLDEPAFRALVEKARSFIVQDRPTSHAAAAEELEARIPCLTFVPSPQDWAGYLVGLAAVRYVQDGDWQGPLAAALRAVPNIDRGVNENHEMGRWAPPPDPPSPGPVPEGVRLFVDGVLEPDLPAPSGLHLVQVRTWGGELRSALVIDAPVPADWFDRRRSGGLAPWWTASATVGLERSTQVVDAPGDWVGDDDDLGPELGGSMALRLAGSGGTSFGLAVDLLATSDPRLDGSIAATLGGRAAVGLGAAVATSERVVDGAVDRSIHLVPTVVGAGTAGDDGLRLDAALAAGWLPSFSRALVRVGLAPPGGAVRFRAGITGRMGTARFVQVDSGRRLATTDWSALAEVGFVWDGRP